MIGPRSPACSSCPSLRLRNSLTQETSLRFLQGTVWQNPPFFMPSVD